MSFIAQTQSRVKACFDTEAEANAWLEGQRREWPGDFRGVVFEADVPLGDAPRGLGEPNGAELGQSDTAVITGRNGTIQSEGDA